MPLFNNSFPQTYQPYYQPQQVANNNGIIWVQGEAGAKSYLVAPNTTVQLWDSENQIIYLKSADASGMPSMRIIDYTIRGSNLPSKDVSALDSKFVGKDELDGLKAKLSALESKINKLEQKSGNRKEHNNG